MPREGKVARRERALHIVDALAAAYPQSTCALRHDSPFQLLVATMLSAQTTDVKVNEVTVDLFASWPTARDLAGADPLEVGTIINRIGLWRNKAHNIVATAKHLVAEHDGQVPTSVDELTKLPGVGKKTATAVLGTAFGLPAGVTVDTHMLRINRLLKLSQATTADGMSRELEALLPPDTWNAYTHRIIDHGRLMCVARRPRCGVCPLAEFCPSAGLAAAGYRTENDEREPASAAGLSWRSRESTPARL